MQNDQTQISAPQSAPFGGLDADPLRVPYSLVVPTGREGVSLCGSGPVEDAPLEDTALFAPLVDHAGENPLGVGDYITHFNRRLRPKVRESVRAQADAFARLSTSNDRASASNAPVLVRLDAIHERTDALVSGFEVTLATIASDRAEAYLRCAEAHARMRLRFDPSEPVPTIPQPETLRSAEAHAADEKLPWNRAESKHFLPAWAEVTLSLVAGGITGLSQFGAAHILHLTSLSHDPTVVIVLAVVFGFAVTLLAGYGVKLLWRLASEAFYLGRCWIGQALLALVTTAALIAIETVVDQKGLMASAGIQAQTMALSGKGSATNGSGSMTLLLIGAFASFAYFVYSSVRGRLKDRSAAYNRVIKAQEDERLAKQEEIRQDPAWIEALAAGNTVIALDAVLATSEQTFANARQLIARRTDELEGRLLPIEDRPSAEDTALMEHAIKEAEVQQSESDRRLLALQERRVFQSAGTKDSNPKRPGIVERIKSLFGGRTRQRSGGRS